MLYSNSTYNCVCIFCIKQNVDKVTDIFEKKSLENLTSFLDYFTNHSQKMNKVIFELQDEIEGMNKEIEFFDKRMEQLQPKGAAQVKSHIDR